MNRYTDHALPGGGATVYETRRSPFAGGGSSEISTQTFWFRDVPNSNIELAGDAQRLDNSTKSAGIRVHAAEVLAVNPKTQETSDVRVLMTGEVPEKGGLGFAITGLGVLYGVIATILAGGASIALVEYVKPDDPNAPPSALARSTELLSWILPIGAGMYLAGKAGYKPLIGGAVGAAGIFLYLRSTKGSRE